MLDIRGVENLTEIGRGGTSVVYSGAQTNFGRTVAVKVFDLTLQRDTDRERFQRECRAIGSLSGHPNIVTVFDEGVLADGRPYLVMEYLPTTLADELHQRGTFTWQQATEIGITVAGALGAAHRAGILHRDVKPENVLLTAEGVPKLTDFGLAQVAGGFDSKTSTVRASLSHASPEMIEGAPVSTASDVYSLASTIHHLISGRPPFVQTGNDSLVTIVSRIVRDAPPSLAAFDVPEPLQDLLRRAMSKDPAARPQDVASFSAELEDVLGERYRRERYVITSPVRVTTAPLTPVALKARQEKRKRQTMVVLAFAAVLGAVTAAVFAGGGDEQANAGTTTVEIITTTSGGGTTSTSSTTSTTSTTIAVPTESLSVTLARDYPMFSALLQSAGLAPLAEGTDPYTLFALPDTAFANVAPESMQRLQSDPNLLLAVMTYHITPGSIPAAQLVTGPLTMLNTQAADVVVDLGTIRIDQANIAAAQVTATNGVIHPIDTLLVPEGVVLTVDTVAPTTTVRVTGPSTTTGNKTTTTAGLTTTAAPVTTLAPTTLAPTTAAPTTADPRVAVPNVVNNDPNTARGRISDAGLTWSEASDTSCTGLNKVTSTSPSAGTLVNPGSNVTLFICY